MQQWDQNGESEDWKAFRISERNAFAIKKRRDLRIGRFPKPLVAAEL
jgi:hypothetical protein